MNEYVKPERATYEMVETFKRAWEAANLRHDPSDPPGTRTNAGLEAVLALLPGRPESVIKAEALREAVDEFESHVGVGEFEEQTVRDGIRWAQTVEAWELQGPFMSWLENRADELDPRA